MMRRWVERGVDGFRMDVIDLISKDISLPDGEPVDGRRTGAGPSASPTDRDSTSSWPR